MVNIIYKMSDKEVWIKIIEDYEISNYGNCRKKDKIINGSIQNKGYKYFQLQRNGKRINYFFHHLVAQAFLGERPTGLVIDHIDRNRLNNNVTNLRYVSQKENTNNRTDIDINKRKGSIRYRCNNYEAQIVINYVEYKKKCKTYEEAELFINETKQKFLSNLTI